MKMREVISVGHVELVCEFHLSTESKKICFRFYEKIGNFHWIFIVSQKRIKSIVIVAVA